MENSDWIEWKGGECPVPPETRVRLRFSDGTEDMTTAGFWGHWWLNNGEPDDHIIAYRIVEDRHDD